MFDKDGKEALEQVKALSKRLYEGGITYSDSPYSTTSAQFNEMKRSVEILKAQVSRINELEAKLNALIELLGVTEEKPEETEHKLVKGKKSVSLERAVKVEKEVSRNIASIERIFSDAAAQSQGIRGNPPSRLA